jgi:hypothetical protein
MSPQKQAIENYDKGWETWHKRTKLQQQISSLYNKNESGLGENAGVLKQAGKILGNSGYSHAKRWDMVSELMEGIQLDENESKYFQALSGTDRKYLTAKNSLGNRKRQIKDLGEVVSGIRKTRNSAVDLQPYVQEEPAESSDLEVIGQEIPYSLTQQNLGSTRPWLGKRIGKVVKAGAIAAGILLVLGVGQKIMQGIDYFSKEKDQTTYSSLIASPAFGGTQKPQVEVVENEPRESLEVFVGEESLEPHFTLDEVLNLPEEVLELQAQEGPTIPVMEPVVVVENERLPIDPGEDHPNYFPQMSLSLTKLLAQSETLQTALGQEYSRLGGTEENLAVSVQAPQERSEAYWTNLMVINAPRPDYAMKKLTIVDEPNKRNLLDVIFGVPERLITFTQNATNYSHLNGFDQIDTLEEFGIIGAEDQRLTPFLADKDDAAQAFENFARGLGVPEELISQAEQGRTDVTENDAYILYSQAYWDSLNDTELPETSRGLVGSVVVNLDEENPEDPKKETRVIEIVGGETNINDYIRRHR